MRVGVISDIHSNVYAFKECINLLEKKGCEEYLLLGDYVSDTPYTKQTMELLHSFIESHKVYCLRGNREEYMLQQRIDLKNNNKEKIWPANSSSGNLLFTYEQLTKKDLDFFEGLPITFIYEKEGMPSITCAHGSPSNSRELLQLDSENTKEWLEKIDTDYLLCAHTHYPGERVYNGKYYFNAGCSGIPIDTPGLAQCMMLEAVGGKWKPYFFLLPFDNKKVIEDSLKGGLSEYGKWFINNNIHILLTGIDKTSDLVNTAAKYQKEIDANKVWPHIDEEYFARAAGELEIPDYRESIEI